MQEHALPLGSAWLSTQCFAIIFLTPISPLCSSDQGSQARKQQRGHALVAPQSCSAWDNEAALCLSSASWRLLPRVCPSQASINSCQAKAQMVQRHPTPMLASTACKLCKIAHKVLPRVAEWIKAWLFSKVVLRGGRSGVQKEVICNWSCPTSPMGRRTSISYPQKLALYHCHFTSLWSAVFQPLLSPCSPAFLSIRSGPLLELKSFITFQAPSSDICHYFSYLEFPSHLDVSWKRTGACLESPDTWHCSDPLWRESTAWGENCTRLSLFFLFAKPMKIFGKGGSLKGELSLSKVNASVLFPLSPWKKRRNKKTNPKTTLSS